MLRQIPHGQGVFIFNIHYFFSQVYHVHSDSYETENQHYGRSLTKETLKDGKHWKTTFQCFYYCTVIKSNSEVILVLILFWYNDWIHRIGLIIIPSSWYTKTTDPWMVLLHFPSSFNLLMYLNKNEHPWNNHVVQALELEVVFKTIVYGS